jgi:hypothetical protein
MPFKPFICLLCPFLNEIRSEKETPNVTLWMLSKKGKLERREQEPFFTLLGMFFDLAVVLSSALPTRFEDSSNFCLLNPKILL